VAKRALNEIGSGWLQQNIFLKTKMPRKISQQSFCFQRFSIKKPYFQCDNVGAIPVLV
jgi:hypothetical protein